MIESGKAITTATPVTHSVPIINGEKPNCPRKGCHEVENSNSLKGFVSRIVLDLKYKPIIIANIMLLATTESNSINLEASLSFKTLFLSIFNGFLRGI